jgi:hypothetical protein
MSAANVVTWKSRLLSLLQLWLGEPMIKTYKFAITGAGSTDVVYFLGFAHTLEEAKTLKAEAQDAGIARSL